MIVKHSAKEIGRKGVTNLVTRAVANYWARKNYSSHIEVGILPWGKRRIDVLTLNTKGQFIGIEVKSCRADYKSDSKWHEYLPFTNKFYFAFPQSMYDSKKLFAQIVEDTKPHGVGILILDENQGGIKVVQNAKKRKMEKAHKTKVIIKLAWRGGNGRHNMDQRFERIYLGK